MPAPSATWSVRRVYGTYRNRQTLAMEPGTWTTTATGRIVNTLADGKKQIFRAGPIASGNLNTTEGQPSIDIELPVTDDPDNTPSGGAVTLTITFTGTGGGSETYTLSPLESWPTGTVGGSGGTDLATLLDPAATPSAPPYVMLGVAGGAAKLDSAGDVVDAAGEKVLGSTVIRPEHYGAVGDGTTDDTAAVTAAFAAANAMRITMSAYADPGATVKLSRTYSLATLSAPVDMMCNVESDGATFSIPSAYSGVAVRVGHSTSGNVLRNANIEVPSVIGTTRAGPAALPSGSVGVQIRNIYTSDVKVGNVLYFETGVQVGGQSHGAAYNRINLRTISYCKVRILLKALDATGWSNQNTYIGGSTTGSVAWEGRRNTGSFGVLLDGVGSSTITGNTFVGTSFESDVYENVIEARNAYQNQWYGCRHEQGVAATSCALTAASATITATGHFLSVGDMVTFTGSSTPTGMNFDQPYYVVGVATNTFTVSRAKGGTAVIFASTGTSIAFSRPQRVKWDKSWDNVIDLPMGPLKWLEQIRVTVLPADTAGNNIRYPSRSTTDAYSPSEWPLHRARNRYTAGSSSQPLWAAYTSTTDPDENPSNWTAALTAKGFNFADGAGAELGWISNNAGVLKYQRLSDSVVYELASCRRTQSGTTLATSTTYNAGTRTSATVALTGVAAGDYVAVSTTTGSIPLGLVIQAQVTAADTITYTVDNLTGSNITLAAGITLWFQVSRRFF